VKAIYKALPVKGKTYTIREVFLGREKILKAGDSATVGLLLEELVNPPDPLHKGQEELGSTRSVSRPGGTAARACRRGGAANWSGPAEDRDSPSPTPPGAGGYGTTRLGAQPKP